MAWADMVAQARLGKGPLKHARTIVRSLLRIRMPVFRPLAALLFAERDMRDMLWPMFLKIVYREPLMRYRCGHVGTGLELEGAMPWIEGSGSIRIGDNVRIGGRNSWTIGYKHAPDAELVIGDRVNVGFQTTIGAAKSVRIGDDTIMAPGVVIFDNPTHPLEPGARLRHETFDIDEARPVEIGRNVWVATGAMIMRGVRIGDGAVVAAGSVVTRDVPAATLVAGNPARVIKAVTAGDREPPSA